MAYTVEITLVDPPGPMSEDGLPVYALPLTYDTVEEAETAAAEHIAELGLSAGSVLFDIKNEDGRSIAVEGSEAEASDGSMP